MAQLTPEQRNILYLQAADRAGIHKSLLAALYEAHQTIAEPGTGVVETPVHLADGETGLGFEPTDCPTFPEQVAYGANVIRVLSDRLIAQSWQGKDLWYPAQGRYSDCFLEIIADGFTPAVEDTQVALLKPCNVATLKTAYKIDIDQTCLPEDLSGLDEHLLGLVEHLPEFYWGLSHQRQACLEAVRIWRNLDTTEAAIESLAQETNKSLRQLAQEDLDITLKQFIQRSALQYQQYPYQREALIRLVQYWRQLPSREAALLDILRDPQPHANLQLLDSVLLHFVTTLPAQYLGKGIQRNALTEAFRVWRQLDSRSTAVTALGVDAEILGNATPEPETLQTVAQQLDRELLNFADRIPRLYRASHQHREALIRLVQLWRELPTREQTIQSLVNDHQHLAQTVPPFKLTISLSERPPAWTTENLELTTSIMPNGQFTWAQATQCGTCWPPNESVIAAIIQVATLLEQAQRQVGLPFMINRWYQPLTMQRAWKTVGEKRHALGDAVELICPGLTAHQLYWALDPWWPGGLGCYVQYPLLCHLDARPYRARWQQE